MRNWNPQKNRKTEKDLLERKREGKKEREREDQNSGMSKTWPLAL